jgi:hypothetical protein
MPSYINRMIEWLARIDPRLLLYGAFALGVLLAFTPLYVSIDRLSRLRLKSGLLYLLLGVLLALLGLTVGLAGASLHTYRKLTGEQPAASVSVHRLGERRFRLTLSEPGAAPRDFEVLGDEWQISARLIRWRGLPALAHFDTVYRLERLSGRDAGTTQDQAPRSAQSLAWWEPVDLWLLLRRYRVSLPAFLPFVDASRESAAPMPLTDGARYAVSVSASRLLVRQNATAPGGESGRR